MIRLALTGGIASGKTFVAALLEALGAVIIDADVLAREVVEPGTPGLAAIIERFGVSVLTADGGLDRPRLAQVVFSERRAREDLNAIVHPRVRQRARHLEAAVAPGSVVVHVIPLLVETGQYGDFDGVLVVDVPEATQRARLRERDAMDEAAIDARLAAQATRSARLRVATWVIDNSGNPDQTRRLVENWWNGALAEFRADRSTCSPRSSGAAPS